MYKKQEMYGLMLSMLHIIKGDLKLFARQFKNNHARKKLYERIEEIKEVIRKAETAE